MKDITVVKRKTYTALYLCTKCHESMEEAYKAKEHELKESRKKALGAANNEVELLAKMSGRSISALCRDLGVSRQCYYKWLRNCPISQENRTKVRKLLSKYIGEDDVLSSKSGV